VIIAVGLSLFVYPTFLGFSSFGVTTVTIIVGVVGSLAMSAILVRWYPINIHDFLFDTGSLIGYVCLFILALAVIIFAFAAVAGNKDVSWVELIAGPTICSGLCFGLHCSHTYRLRSGPIAILLAVTFLLLVIIFFTVYGTSHAGWGIVLVFGPLSLISLIVSGFIIGTAASRIALNAVIPSLNAFGDVAPYYRPIFLPVSGFVIAQRVRDATRRPAGAR